MFWYISDIWLSPSFQQNPILRLLIIIHYNYASLTNLASFLWDCMNSLQIYCNAWSNMPYSFYAQFQILNMSQFIIKQYFNKFEYQTQYLVEYCSYLREHCYIEIFEVPLYEWKPLMATASIFQNKFNILFNITYVGMKIDKQCFPKM